MSKQEKVVKDEDGTLRFVVVDEAETTVEAPADEAKETKRKKGE